VSNLLGHRPPLHLISGWKITARLSGALARRRYGLAANVIDWFSVAICACSEDPGYDPFPLRFLARIGLTDLSLKVQPDNPDAEFEQIAAIASKAFSKLNKGGILVHCVGGRGRV
jgi:hypothetical protein